MSVGGKLKILHLIDTGGQGGAEQVLYSLIEKLAGDLYLQHVLLPNDVWLYGKIEKLEGVKVVIFNGQGRFNLKFIRFIVAYVLKHRIQIIHSHLFGSSLYASLAGFITRVPVICTFHGFIDLSSRNILQSLKMNIIGLLASRIVAVSDGLKEYLGARLGFGKQKLVTIYNGIDIDSEKNITRSEARKIYECYDNQIVIGAIGNLKPEKGYDIFLRAAKIISTKYDNCIFLIAGNFYADIYIDLLKQREELSLVSKVTFLGFQENISVFLNSLDVFLLTSNSEGFSLATIEAMNAYIPVVATRSGGPQEIISHGFNGLLADVGDAISLANHVISIIESDKLKKHLISNAELTVVSKFNIDVMVNNYVLNYKKHLNKC